MAKTLNAGDRVTWSSHGETAKGKVVSKMTKPMTIKGHKVAASRDNPEYHVETEDERRAAHKASALTKA